MAPTFEQFTRAFDVNWRTLESKTGKTPDVVIIGDGRGEATIRACLEALGLDAHVIVDMELPANTMIITDHSNLSLMPGDPTHGPNGPVIGGGKN